MKKIWIIAFAAVLAVNYCKKSVAGQTQQWQNALKDLDEATTPVSYTHLEGIWPVCLARV